jgi:hypothetical protein
MTKTEKIYFFLKRNKFVCNESHHKMFEGDEDSFSKWVLDEWLKRNNEYVDFEVKVYNSPFKNEGGNRVKIIIDDIESEDISIDNLDDCFNRISQELKKFKINCL